jgi:hypothetical protein
MDDRTPELRIGDAERHDVAEILRRAAGEGRITLEELDERLEAAYGAKTYADLVPLTADLPLAQRPATPPAAPAPGNRVEARPGSSERHLCILSGMERKGVWTMPEQMTVVAFMGGADLDLREATFAARECTLVINAVMGGASIRVGPGVNVVMEGTAIMGGYSGPGHDASLGPDAPMLRIKGFALMGGVDVSRRPALER